MSLKFIFSIINPKKSSMDKSVALSPSQSWKIYLIFCITNILLNIDQGVLPAATNEMMIDLDLTEMEFGLLGSLMYIGLITGSLVAGWAYQRFSCKKVLIVNIIMMAFCLSLFTFNKNVYLLGFSRISTGFFQVFLVIFFPVWVDLFVKENKTLWLSILQIGVPMGTFFGYIITIMSLKLLNWKWGFWFQIILLLPSLIFIIFFEDKNLDTQRSPCLYSSTDIKNDKEIIESIQSSKIGHKGSDTSQTGEFNYIKNIKFIFSSRIYICSMLSISSLLFIVTGIQYWGTDYYRNVMKQEKDIVFITYSLVSITGPTLGVLFGGYFVNKQGGYNSKNALKTCVWFGFFAVFFAFPFPFVPYYYVAVAMMWFLLFFGGALMPILTGIMISSLPKKCRTFGNSAAQFFLNLLGFLPAPFVYGFVCKLTGGRESLWGMVSIMSWSVFGFLTVLFGYLYDESQRKKQAKAEGTIEEGLIVVANDLSSIGESSESEKQKQHLSEQINDKNVDNNIYALEKKDSGSNVNPLQQPVLKKQSSFIPMSYTGSIIAIGGNIPKISFNQNKRKKKNQQFLNVSYDLMTKEKEKEKNENLSYSVDVLKDAQRNRLKSCSINYVTNNLEMSSDKK